MLMDNLRTVPTTTLGELEYLLVQPMALNKLEPQRMELMAKVNSVVDWTLDWPKQHLLLWD